MLRSEAIDRHPMSSARDQIVAVFSVDGPVVDESWDLDLLANNYECKEFISRLRGKKWIDLLDDSVRAAISDDPLIWTTCMPQVWFPYYLPGLILISCSGDDPFASNLRGLLDQILAPRTYTSDSAKRLNKFIRSVLSLQQWETIELCRRSGVRPPKR